MKSLIARALVVAVASLAWSGPLTGPSASPVDPCVPRLLVLSAYPGEIDKLLTTADVSGRVVLEGRSFYVGTLAGNEVVLALSGIGLINAENTTRSAIAHFRCAAELTITGVVFSGVAGGKWIGDVTVPVRWTRDGVTWTSVDPDMLALAESVAQSGSVRLARRAPLGDLACLGIDPNLVRTVQVENVPKIRIGGDGKSADSFGGRAWPCFPGGGDVFGCEPCRAPAHSPPDLQRFIATLAPFIDPAFILGFFQSPPPATTTYTAEDMETAAVAEVAAEHGIPFIAFRAVSDGMGDPLHLPGFPVQFFVYRALAAENAATVTLAFLEAWAAP